MQKVNQQALWIVAFWASKKEKFERIIGLFKITPMPVMLCGH